MKEKKIIFKKMDGRDLYHATVLNEDPMCNLEDTEKIFEAINCKKQSCVSTPLHLS